jgi:hypothetical protein
MKEKIIRFKNRKGSRIEIIYFEDDDVWITAERKKSFRWNWNGETMPITKNCLVATLWDYEKILKIVLRFDRAARKWFRRNVKSIVIDENGLTLGDFILPNDIVDYEKAREYDHMILGLDNK